jgi:hypothetical protein
MRRSDRAYYRHLRFAEDVMRKPLAIIAALLLAAAVLGVIAAAPMALSYS